MSESSDRSDRSPAYYYSSNNSCSIYVIFGRPGAGKTTVAEKARELYPHTVVPGTSLSSSLPSASSSSSISNARIQCLDLDVCVPQWMRDNFSKGIYPTLKQRQAFATSACDYIDDELRKLSAPGAGATDPVGAVGAVNEDDNGTMGEEKVQVHKIVPKKIPVLISFSFVNTDLRDVFRSRFPDATWILMDTSDSEAQDRIHQREGHFYKGHNSNSNSSSYSKNHDDPPAAGHEHEQEGAEGSTPAEPKPSDATRKDDDDDVENSEWFFAPVSFQHVILDGLNPVDENARKVIDILRSSC